VEGKTVVEVTSENFETTVLGSDRPVLVDFWASWCGPCRALAPHLDTLSEQSEGRYQVVKVNVEDAPELAAQYQVRALPTLVVFENGEEARRKVGSASIDAIKELVVGQ
jgi:thioredoxin 1